MAVTGGRASFFETSLYIVDAPEPGPARLRRLPQLSHMRSHNDARSVLQHVTSRTPSRLHARFRFVAAACAPTAAIRAHSGVAEIKEMHRT